MIIIMIAKTTLVYPNVKISEGTIIEDNCIIGLPSKNATSATIMEKE